MEPKITEMFQNEVLHAYHLECRDEAFSNTGLRHKDDFEICLPRAGYFGKQLHGESYYYHTQAMMLTNAREEHVLFHGDREHDHCTILLLNEALLEEADFSYWHKDTSQARGEGTVSDERFRLPLLSVSPEIDYLHYRIQKILALDNIHINALEIESMLMDLIAMIYGQQYGGQQFRNDGSTRTKNDNIEVVDRAKSLMLAKFDEDLSLSDICSAAFKSKFHFIRLFKQITRQTPYQYLVDVRLAHAESLILDTNQSITDISSNSGYTNYPHFIKSFTQHYGVSPLRYRGGVRAV